MANSSDPFIVKSVLDQRPKIIKQFIISDDFYISALVVVGKDFTLTFTQMPRTTDDDHPFWSDTAARYDYGIGRILAPPTHPIAHLLHSMGYFSRFLTLSGK